MQFQSEQVGYAYSKVRHNVKSRDNANSIGTRTEALATAVRVLVAPLQLSTTFVVEGWYITHHSSRTSRVVT